MQANKWRPVKAAIFTDDTRQRLEAYTYVSIMLLAFAVAPIILVVSSFTPFVLTLQEANVAYYNLFMLNEGPVEVVFVITLIGLALIAGYIMRNLYNRERLKYLYFVPYAESAVGPVWPILYMFLFGLQAIFWVCKLPLGSAISSFIALLIIYGGYYRYQWVISVSGMAEHRNDLRNYGIAMKFVLITADFIFLQNLFATLIEFKVDAFTTNQEFISSFVLTLFLVLIHVFPANYFNDWGLWGLVGMFSLLTAMQHATDTTYYWIVALSLGVLCLFMASGLAVYRLHLVQKRYIKVSSN